ncbi:hypothetical protein M422DRAFT_249287 [Sphaerobolus stellatus SS14]|uniref:Uncharacterized protein n=1 Tax=Sphaerobolus stellatus (strain SS14) TaxID=990650 RepID=A0A0C9VI71_SPHS4|nr:hypothetical protein M422DRAFT_249287 [Sphaerobolus stellatus SS14]
MHRDWLSSSPYVARHRCARFHVISRLRSLPVHELHPMFLEPLVMQANSPDLLFFDRDLERIIPFPYPMFNGALIMPKGLKKYCETRRIMWECWCGLYTPEPAFIQFYGDHGYIYARCRTCGLDVCFNDKYRTSTMQASYQGYPKDCRLMPMPSIPPPIRREIEAPHFDQHWFMPGPNAPGRRLTPLPQLPVSSPPPSEYLSTRRGHSSPGPAVAGPSRFPGAYAVAVTLHTLYKPSTTMFLSTLLPFN